MLVVFINLITILVASIALSLIINEDLYKTIPTITISIPLIIMYVACFFNLDIAVIVIYVLALFLVIYALFKNRKDYIKFKKFINNNKFVVIVYLIIAIYFIFVNFKRPAWGWDDFSHWARVVKNMNYTRHLNRSTDVYLSFPHYPPNVSLFLYFFDYQKVFCEWQLFYAQSLYTVTLVFPFAFYIGKGKSNFYKLLLLFLAMLIPSSINIVAYISLFVDNIMGLLLGYAMLEYLFNDNFRFKFVNIILALMALTLTKDAGAILAIIFIAIIVLNELSKSLLKNTKLKNDRSQLKYIILTLVLVIFAYISYKFYLSQVGINNVDYAKTYKDVLVKMNPWAPTTIKNFYHSLFEYSFGNVVKMSVVNIIMIVILLITILLKLKKKYSYNNINIVLYSVGGFIIYLLLLLYTYICRFSEYESIHLASYDRYISTYILFLCVIIIALFALYFPKVENIIIILVLFALSFNPVQGVFQITLGTAYNKKNHIQEQLFYEKKSDFLKSFMNEKDTVHVVSIGNEGYNVMRISYSLGPEYKVYYMGEPSTTDGGLYSNVITLDEYIKKLNDNDVKYIYLDSINDKYMEDYSALFESVNDINNNTIFRINDIGKFERLGE